MAPLGKKELLSWAAETTGIRPCNKYADLRDGVVFLVLASRLFPASVDLRSVQRHPPDVVRNWDTLRRVLEQHGLPVHLCDRHAIAAGHARHCFNMLVLFYFLTKLSRDSDFCVDFANPIDTAMAAFLQSPQSLLCLGKQPAAETTSDMRSTNTSTTAGPTTSNTTATTTTTTIKKKPAFTSTSTTANEITTTGTEDVSHANTSARPCTESQRESLLQPPPGAVATATLSTGVHSHPMSSRSSSRVSGDEGNPIGNDSTRIHSLRAQNARLQEELDHVRVTSQVMLAQQRVLVASELTRMTEQFEAQMALVRLEHDHELRQCLIDLREEYNNFIVDMRGDTVAPSGLVHTLESKVHTLERELAQSVETIQQLRRTITAQRDRHEAFAQKIQSISANIPPAELDESTFVESILSLIEPSSQQQQQQGLIQKQQQEVLWDTVALRLKTMVSQIKTLHSETERLRSNTKSPCNNLKDGQDTNRLRLQLERLQLTNQFLRQQRRQQQQEHQRHQQQQQQQQQYHQPQELQKDWYAIPLANGMEAPSCMIDSETCDTICARALSVVKESHTGVNSPIFKEVQRLVTVIQILQSRVETASSTLIAYRDKQQNLYEDLLWAQQKSENEAREHQRTMEAKLDEQRLRIEAKEAAESTKMRLVEERATRRESIANMLHERLREMISSLQQQQQQSHQVNDGVALRAGMQKAMQQLVADVVKSQRTQDSFEAAVRDLSEEVAMLRRQLGQREREEQRLQAALTAATGQQQEKEKELTHAKAEVHTLRDAVNIELDALRHYIGRVGDLLMMEKPPQTILQPSNNLKTPFTTNSSRSDAAVPPLSSSSSSTTTTIPTPSPSPPPVRFPSYDSTRPDSLKREEQSEDVASRASTATPGVTTAAFVGSTPSLLLSSEELERRKKAILSKYGFNNNINNNRIEH
ncbi:uncharacterized protein TM35_000064670 [Trypanosoma theileri]|uniref:Calponin-homology (CH) domain-containing protein n=1 Tax=Trypanosoma theileri TaxID=67003 RepID=A0A1X0P3G0_9TRYP|nr:uncharacterized protein TM35_000064670 [Trypanosoma theileri]ORC91462.1 hypothetical protein TM35_000064670 [Trypanosoma theileri]